MTESTFLELGTFEQGWLQGVRHVPSPNFNARPADALISLLVIHNISLPPQHYGGPYIERFFQNQLDWTEHPYFETIRGLEVSAHFLVYRTGEVVQFVSCEDRAWHAGRSCFGGRENCNDFSIGIELEGADTEPYTDAQYVALHALSWRIMSQYPSIDATRVVGHCDIAPGRKTDPGPSFDWQHYRAALTKSPIRTTNMARREP